jgi:hypothetical protein
MSPVRDHDLTIKKNQFYVAMWYILVITGTRPTELLSAQFRIDDDGIGVRFNGRKNSKATAARYWKFLYTWTYTPSIAEIQRISNSLDSDGRVISLKEGGESFQIAQAINAWLKKHDRHIIDGLQITSTSPRVFLDNILGRIFEQGGMPLQLFEDLMGHTIKVSRANYQR